MAVSQVARTTNAMFGSQQFNAPRLAGDGESTLRLVARGPAMLASLRSGATRLRSADIVA